MNTDKTHSPARVLRTPGQLFSSFANAAAFALAAAVAATAGPGTRAQYAPLSTQMPQSTATTTVPRPSVSTTSAGASSSVRPDDEAVQLGCYVVSASRTAQDPRYTPSSVTLFTIDDFRLSQITDLRSALAGAPGVSISSHGGVGSQSNFYMRGAEPRHTLVFVDGVRMNDKSAEYDGFLGGADLGGIDRLEILRGPQSTLYGSSAMAGVIVFNTPRGCGKPAGAISGEAGSFGSWNASANISGGSRVLGYSASLSRIESDNDRPGNNYTRLGYTARLEYAPRADNMFLFGGTFRGSNGDYDEAGSTAWPSIGKMDRDNYLGTLYAQLKIANAFTTRLTGALEEQRFLWTPEDLIYDSINETRNKRTVLDWQNTWQAISQLELVGGLNYEKYKYNVASIADYDDESIAAYASATYRPVETIVLTAGIRYDDYDSAGDATTGRLGVSWMPFKTTKIHATLGTGFAAPSLRDIFGQDNGWWAYLPNPALSPEKSTGGDIGVEQRFFNDRLTVDVIYFENRFRDMLDTVNVGGWDYQWINVDRATTRGVEFTLAASITDTLQLTANYTYTDAKDTNDKVRLGHRPRHVVNGEIRWQAMRDLAVGAGVRGVMDRIDSTGKMEDYAIVRIFASYTWRPYDLTFKLRAENVLNEKYEEIRNYPALPAAIYAGVEWKF